MGLFTSAWQSKNEKKALEAVKNVTDEKSLFRIALESPLETVQLEALKKISDPSLLFLVATCSKKYALLQGKEKYNCSNITDNTQMQAAERLPDNYLLDATNAMFASLPVKIRIAELIFSRQDSILLKKLIAGTKDSELKKDACKELCRLTEHDWDGCRCRNCGEIRDEGHDFVFDRKEINNDYVHVEISYFKCRRCGKEKLIRRELGEPQAF